MRHCLYKYLSADLIEKNEKTGIMNPCFFVFFFALDVELSAKK